MSDNIKVFVKVRPLISREIQDKLPYQWRVNNNTLYQLDSNGRDFGQSFTFDKVYDEKTKTSDVYNDVAKPIVESATAGINGTIFAYGQTSSGKTFTMTGTEESPGIIQLAVLNLFEIIRNIPDRDFLVRVSYIEIYNETLKDLLDLKRDNIKIHETYDGNIKVDASERVTSSPEEVLEAMKEGEANRQKGATNMNETSSRSHSIFQITIESREHIEGEEQAGSVNVSQLNLVDLAGSERAGQTGATGRRFKEGTHINKSLSVLALVIKQLSEGPNKYANYRDSKLTRILQNSLGGNAKTSIICAVTPAAVEETISTLQFANRAKAIKNKPEVNAVATDATMIQSLTKQLSRLQAELQNKKNLEVMLETKKHVEQDLQKQIAKLQKLILNGFGQRQSIENIGGIRRPQPNRRMTISTLHSISEDPSPSIPRFCTPSLKYNPMVISNVTEFAPTQKNTLATLHEEPPRVVTPPPYNKTFKPKNQDIVEIDSDDDEAADTSSSVCSPVHKCYHLSKTPPCVLRKNAKEAEKNYDEILEFTTREKMYPPSVVEVLKQLEDRSDTIIKLQDEVTDFKKITKEKDSEIDALKYKVKKTDEELTKIQSQLDACIKDYNTKLTDWEVSYETLKKKAKLREDELLSLLDEQKFRKSEEIGKFTEKLLEKDIPFMDMSKDISLVNSDSESSIVNPNDEKSSEQIKKLVTSLQDQLLLKGQTILQLEADIASQNKSIEFLEQSSHKLQKLVDNYIEKVTYVENENTLLKSTVDTLNATVKSQKENLEMAQRDIKSYNDVIQELQIKLSKKDNLLNLNINDSVLESMIANEDKVLANNENMKNIIHCFKIALQNRSKEIEELKLLMTQSNESQYKTVVENLSEKMKQIEILNEEIAHLKEQINENITTVNKLMRDKTNLSIVEQELTEKLSEIEDQKNELFEISKANAVQIQNLNEINERNLSLLNAKEKENSEISTHLQSKINSLSNKIIQLEEEIKEKNNLLTTLEKQNNEEQEYKLKAKAAIDKLKSIICILNGEINEIPEFINDLITSFNTMLVGLNALEKIATDTVKEKNVILKEHSQLKIDFTEINNKYAKYVTTIEHEIETLKKEAENHLIENTNLKNTNAKLSEEICTSRKIFEAKCNEYNMLQELCDSITISENNLKDKHQALQENLDILLQKSTTADKVEHELNNKCTELSALESKLNHLAEEKKTFVEMMCKKLGDISNTLKIQKPTNDEICENSTEYVLFMLDQLVNFAIQYNSINLQNKKIMENLLHESQKETEIPRAESNTLRNKLTNIENEKLTTELEKIYTDNKTLQEQLIGGAALLDQLKEDLRIKAGEIESMKNKVKNCQDEFINHDTAMKEQMQYLQIENEKLKNRLLELKSETDYKVDILSKQPYLTDDSNTDTLMPEEKKSLEKISPPSLLTICCNTIVDAMEPKQHDNSSVTTTSSVAEFQNTACSTCDQLLSDLRITQQENASLSTILKQLEIVNKELIQEQLKVRQEVKLLLEPALELQKKISSHKTNLTILTATTYAENKLLTSQVKALQHHQSRFHDVCARDIPEFKIQLNKLLTLLKGDSTLADIHNVNLKRHSLPDVNESTLDGDLLMLDTNVTMTTSGDNTLVGCDQTSLDLTQTLYNDSCQTHDTNENNANNVMSVLEADSRNIFQKLEVLKEENNKLKELVNKLSKSTESKVDTNTSPIKIAGLEPNVLCTNCTILNEIPKVDSYKEVERLKQVVSQIQEEKDIIETKYNNLLQEVTQLDSKIKEMQKESNIKSEELTKLNTVLNNKYKEMKSIQEENDLLSTQVMENISEVDDLNKELNKLKILNIELIEKIQKLDLNGTGEQSELVRPRLQDLTEKTLNHSINKVNSTQIGQSNFDDEVVRPIQINSSPRAKLSRSFSDSDTSSRYNKICTLQHELYAGREDCKELKEDVASIKHHLDCSNMSVDLDDSMGDAKILALSKESKVPSIQEAKCNMPDIEEEPTPDPYTLDKIDCYNYYWEVTGVEKERVQSDVKIINIMKMFHNNLVAKHGNEIENLLNQLRCCEESQKTIQSYIDNMTGEYENITETVEKKENDLKRLRRLMYDLKTNIDQINMQYSNPTDRKALRAISNMLKQNVLNRIDYDFGIASSDVFNLIVNKYEEDIVNIEKCNDKLTSELEVANSNLTELKINQAEREQEYNLLKAQKIKIQDISNAVTLDIVKKEEELNTIIIENSRKLFELSVIAPNDLSTLGSAVQNINMMFDRVISQLKLRNNEQKQLENEALKAKESDLILHQKEKELEELKTQIQTLKDINNNITHQLTDKDIKLKELETLYSDLHKNHKNQRDENTKNLNLIEQLSQEMGAVKAADLDTIRNLKTDIERLKAVNQMILQEKESYSIDLEKANETIKQNNVEIGKMSTDILILRESTKDATVTIGSLKEDLNKLLIENSELKQNYEEMSREFSRLKINMKTHEKTAEIQNRTIKRLKQEKEEDNRLIGDKQIKIEELTQKYSELQNECQELKVVLSSCQEKMENLRSAKEAIENRVSELEEASNKPRLSLDAITESSRRRRQSLHDSKRILADLEEHRDMEQLFEARQKHDDIFMEVDDDNSDRSTPFGFAKGRDSTLSKTDQSDKDEDCSRPSSVLAVRRRRQSTHDLNRGVVPHTPSPHDLSHAVIDEINHAGDTSANRSGSSEVNSLKLQLAAVKRELEEMTEKYREVDEECEICASYLKEKEEQCKALRACKSALEVELEALKAKMSIEQNTSGHSQSKPSVGHVSVNTDEDWANLHAVVVDRMSFDAEVEKNKKLRKIIEELRFTKQDLRNTITKMQKALEKHSSKDTKELEATKEELETVKEELKELRAKYKELDEECETCASYLKEKEEQCKALRACKSALESKLQELQENSHSSLAHSVRKKRQTVHDMNRNSVMEQNEVATDTSDDLLSYQVERDSSSQKKPDDTQLKEMKRLRMTIEKLRHEKSAMEQQLRSVHANPTYVATGSAIVQNQQITDVMRENHRLKIKNQKLAILCKKLTKSEANRENEDPIQQG